MNLREDKCAARNLSKSETLALRKLQNNTTFIIKESDKGGNVVVWPVNMYLQEAYRQLNNNTLYQKLPMDPMCVFKKKLDRLLAAAMRLGVIQKQDFF